tara:strand:+ start:969 stop:1145 length:177 start_codon:yes stop_codon:yes gene_type:complete
MRFKDIVISDHDLECLHNRHIRMAIEEHIIDLGLATSETLTGFNWRIDVRMRMDNDDT